MNVSSALDQAAHWYVRHRLEGALMVLTSAFGVFFGEAELVAWLVRVALRG